MTDRQKSRYAGAGMVIGGVTAGLLGLITGLDIGPWGVAISGVVVILLSREGA